jgi:probable rRNA maturation factor
MKPALPTVDILVSAPAWTRALSSASRIIRRAAHAAWTGGAPAALKRRANAAELSIALVSDAAIRKLNAAYRRKDKPTNVLSFPAGGNDGLRGPAALILGDVVIAYGTVAKEAKAAGKSLKDHLSHMVVHGVLHLLGYDHEVASDAKTMERLETKILSELGIEDPYREADPQPSIRTARAKPARGKRGRP